MDEIQAHFEGILKAKLGKKLVIAQIETCEIPRLDDKKYNSLKKGLLQLVLPFPVHIENFGGLLRTHLVGDYDRFAAFIRLVCENPSVDERLPTIEIDAESLEDAKDFASKMSNFYGIADYQSHIEPI